MSVSTRSILVGLQIGQALGEPIAQGMRDYRKRQWDARGTPFEVALQQRKYDPTRTLEGAV